MNMPELWEYGDVAEISSRSEEIKRLGYMQVDKAPLMPGQFLVDLAQNEPLGRGSGAHIRVSEERLRPLHPQGLELTTKIAGKWVGRDELGREVIVEFGADGLCKSQNLIDVEFALAGHQNPSSGVLFTTQDKRVVNPDSVFRFADSETIQLWFPLGINSSTFINFSFRLVGDELSLERTEEKRSPLIVKLLRV